ncbi:Lipid droplet-associated hydrolase [Linum grandiflorum]
MVLRFLAISTIFSRCLHSPPSRKSGCSNFAIREMGTEYLDAEFVKSANFRLCKVSSYTTELLEIQSDDPTLHVLFVPGNPGVVSFYKDFLESLYGSLRGTATITAIGHIGHTKKNYEHGKLFSLQQQINHKVDFISHELQETKVPIVLVGHSIGSHIAMETLRQKGDKVMYFVGLYPFMMSNPLSKKQASISKVSRSRFLSGLMSFMVAFIGILPKWLARYMVLKYIGNSTWSNSAVETAQGYLLKYHVFRNMLHMVMTEFKEAPDWEFMRENHSRMAFLFGVDDHWGPLQLCEDIAKHVPEMTIAMEREGHSHSFCCTEAGSVWVARHVASLIQNQTSMVAAADGERLTYIDIA